MVLEVATKQLCVNKSCDCQFDFRLFITNMLAHKKNWELDIFEKCVESGDKVKPKF